MTKGERELLKQVRTLVKAMVVVERKYGHHGVFMAIRDWLNEPLRKGGFLTR